MTQPTDGYSVSKVTDSPSTKSPTPRRQPFVRRAIVSAVVGAGLIGVVQLFAPDFDYQYAFFACAAIALVAVAFTLYNLQRAGSAAGHIWWVPLTTLVVLIGFVSTVRVRTMSGEMIPQLGWRFSTRDVPKLRTSIAPEDASPITSSPAQPADATVSSETSATEIPSNDLPDNTTTISVSSELAAGVGPLGGGEAPGDSWTQFLGNDRNGIVAERSFAIASSADEVKTMWNIGIGSGWSSFAIAGEIAVTLEQREDRECVTAYRVTDGELLWIVDHEARHDNALGETGPRSTPTIDRGRVYAQGATGRVRCLDLQSGAEIWTVDLLQLAGWNQPQSETAITWGRSGSPLLVDGLCVLPLGSPEQPGTPVNELQRSLVALDAASGEVRWRAGSDQISYSSPQLMTLAGVRQIVIVNENTITGHDIESGATLWKTDWAGQSNGGANCASVIPAGVNRFLIGKGYGGGSALIEVRAHPSGDGFECEDIWRSNRIMKTKFNHAVIREGIAYGLSNGALQAVEVESGRRLWEQPRRSRSGQGQVILAGAMLIVQEEMGDVIFVDADPNEYNERLRLDALQHKTWNVPSLVGNVLLIRNSVQAMALRLPEKAD